MKRRNELSWRGMLAHPLTVAILLYVPLLLTNTGVGAKLLLLEPVAMASSEARIDELPNDLSAEQALQWQIKQLQENNAALANQAQLLRESYVQLHDFEKAYGSLVHDLVPARILLRAGDSSPWRQGLYLNVGSKDGIEVGFPVVQGRTLVGRIDSVGPNTSVVALITDSSFRVPVSILPQKAVAPRLPTPKELQLNAQPENAPHYVSETRGILRGNASDELRAPRIPLDDVAVDAAVARGNIVVSNDASGNFPAGLLIGYVEEVQNQNTFLSIRVKSAMDLRLNDVLLVIPHRRPTLDDATRILAGEHHLDPKKRG